MKLSKTAILPTKHGIFNIQSIVDDKHKQHVILYKGDVHGQENVPIRIHSQCLTSEVFGSLRCDCDEQLEAALSYFAERELGILIYLRQEGRGIGLFNKIEAYALQDAGLDTIEANRELGLPIDSRSYEVAIAVLQAFAIKSVCVMTNNPDKIEALEKNHIRITERIPINVSPNSFNCQYLDTKKTKNESHPLNTCDDNIIAYVADKLNNTNLARPFVTLSFAQSLDGCITTEPGKKAQFSNTVSQTMTHQLRALHDTILVGINTVLVDDPRLTVRLVDGNNPTPIVLDSRLRLPITAKILQNNRITPIIATTTNACAEREAQLVEAGAKVLRIGADKHGCIALHELLACLFKLGSCHIMVEGGAKVITSFLSAGLVDQLVLTIAPLLIGGVHAVNNMPHLSLKNLPQPKNLHYQWLAGDLVIGGDLGQTRTA